MTRRGERGFALLIVFLMAAAIALLLYRQMPRVAFESQRDKEQRLIERGEQFKRGIQLYFVNFKKYPSKIEDLENTNNKRFLRRRYIDPMTGKDEWRLVHVNGAGMLTDSLVQKPPKPAGDKTELAGNAGTGTATGTGANPDGASEVNEAVKRRPSDRPLTPAPGAAPETAAVDPNDPRYWPPITLYPAGQTNVQTNTGQPGANLQGFAQQFPGQQFQGQPYPGQPNVPGFPGQQQVPIRQFAAGQFPVQQFPGQQNSVQQFQQFPGQQFPGQQFPGQQNPAQQFPGQPFPGVTPGLPIQPRTFNPNQGGALPQCMPHQNPIGQGINPQIGSPQPAQIVPPVNGPCIPNVPEQPYPNQPLQTGVQTGVQNAALAALDLALRTPRQPPNATSAPNNPLGAGGLAGVASTYAGPSIKLYRQRGKYNEWEFIFDLKQGLPGQPPTPTTPPLQPAQPTPQPTK